MEPLTPEAAMALVKRSAEIGILQSENEARDFAMFVANTIRPKHFMEIGTCSGGNFLLLHLVSEPGLRISVDMPWKDRDPQVFGHQERFYGACAGAFCQPVEIIGNSHSDEVKRKVKEALGDTKLDLIFQDASHDYEGAKRDFMDYAQLLKPHGYYAQHDLLNGWPCGEYMRKELFPAFEHWTFRDDANLFGIGVVRVP